MSNVTSKVEQFYTDHPFPDFDLSKYTCREDLESRASWYFRLLDTFIPPDASIIEIGCGTGQLVNFLACKPERRVTGLDLSAASLAKAGALRDKLGLDNLTLIRRNIFDIEADLGSYQYTFCNGVLHHTGDTYKALQSILKVVPPGGYVIVGYYNTIARFPLAVAQAFISKTRPYSIAEKRAHLARLYTVDEFDDSQIDSWFYDQFLHPHEETVSVATGLDWFRRHDIEYLNSFPPIELGRTLRHANLPHLNRNPFLPPREAPWKYGSLPLLLSQLIWMMQPRNEGGYYTLLGRKKAKP